MAVASIAYAFTTMCEVLAIMVAVPSPEVTSGWIGFISLLGLAIVGWYDRLRVARSASTIDNLKNQAKIWEDRCQQCESQRLYEIERHESIVHSLREQVSIAQNNATMLQQQVNEIRDRFDGRKS